MCTFVLSISYRASHPITPFYQLNARTGKTILQGNCTCTSVPSPLATRTKKTENIIRYHLQCKGMGRVASEQGTRQYTSLGRVANRAFCIPKEPPYLPLPASKRGGNACASSLTLSINFYVERSSCLYHCLPMCLLLRTTGQLHLVYLLEGFPRVFPDVFIE